MLGRLFDSVVERIVVGRGLTGGTVALVRASSAAVRRAQTGLLRYYAAWAPNDLRKGSPTRPKMLRITMTVDDPNGRLTEGQTFEYVIDLP